MDHERLKCADWNAYRDIHFFPSLSRRRLELDELIRRHHLRVKSFRNEHKDWGIKSGGGGWRDRKGEGEKNAKSSIDKRASTNISTRQRVFRCNYPPPTPINSYIISQLNYTIRIHSISPCRDLQDLRGRKMIPSLDPMTGLREEEFPSRATCTTTTRTTTRGQWRKKIRGETRLRSWSVEGGYVETIEAIKVDK